MFKWLVNSTWQNHVYWHIASSRHIKLEPAARYVDHVAVLDIRWFCRLAANSRPKINGLCALYTVNHTRQMNIARASIVTHSACFHDSLVHSGRAIENDWARLISKAGDDHRGRAVLQRNQHFVVVDLPFVAADELMLKIDNSLAGSRDFADKRQTQLAV